MKKVKAVVTIAIATVFLSACQKEFNPATNAAGVDANNSDLAVNGLSAKENQETHVYTLSNQLAGNQVLDYVRGSNGMLSFSNSWSTGGNGTGGGLGSQGAVIVANAGKEKDEVVLAVNAGSNTISSFEVNESGLDLRSTVNSGGTRPISITQYDDMVFVLNAGGTGNISGFRLAKDGSLQAIPNSTRPLSTSASGPAQISFVSEGKVLAITEKATNRIITYTVDKSGEPGDMHMVASANNTPFGFAAGKDDIFVSEAAGGAPGASTLSSYRIKKNGMITLEDGPVGANQTAACWVAITNDLKYVYAANAGSSNVSSFRVNNAGNITVNEAVAATAGAGPVDATISSDSKYLYVLSGGSHTINVYKVANNGALTTVQSVPGLPTGTVGIASE